MLSFLRIVGSHGTYAQRIIKLFDIALVFCKGIRFGNIHFHLLFHSSRILVAEISLRVLDTSGEFSVLKFLIVNAFSDEGILLTIDGRIDC